MRYSAEMRGKKAMSIFASILRAVYRLSGVKKSFTLPYETASSLKARLDGMCADVDMGNLKSMAWFVCRKAK